MVFLDCSNAFETVWHGKIIRLGVIPESSLLLAVRLVFSGVSQGSLLVPDLFNIFTSDLSIEPGTSLAVYADDTAVYAVCRNEAFVHRLGLRSGPQDGD